MTVHSLHELQITDREQSSGKETDFNGFSADDEKRRRHMIRREKNGRTENKTGAQDRRSKNRGAARGHLQRCHVVEGMVQLLTNGFVLELLSIQFIWRSEVDRKFRQVPKHGGNTKAGEGMRDRWRRREEGGRRRQTLVRIFWRITLITEKMNIWFSLRLLSSVGFEH